MRIYISALLAALHHLGVAVRISTDDDVSSNITKPIAGEDNKPGRSSISAKNRKNFGVGGVEGDGLGGTKDLMDDKLLQTLAIAAADVYEPGSMLHRLEKDNEVNHRSKENGFMKLVASSHDVTFFSKEHGVGSGAEADDTHLLDYKRWQELGFVGSFGDRSNHNLVPLKMNEMQWAVYEIMYPEKAAEKWTKRRGIDPGHECEFVFAIRGTELTTSKRDVQRNWDLFWTSAERYSGVPNIFSLSVDALTQAVLSLEGRGNTTHGKDCIEKHCQIRWLHIPVAEELMEELGSEKEWVEKWKSRISKKCIDRGIEPFSDGFKINYVTGHSLGGALAEVLAGNLKRDGAAFNPRVPCHTDAEADRCPPPKDVFYQKSKFEVHITDNDHVIGFADAVDVSHKRTHVQEPPHIHHSRMSGILPVVVNDITGEKLVKTTPAHSMDCMIVNIGCPEEEAEEICNVFPHTCRFSMKATHAFTDGTQSAVLIGGTALGLVGHHAGVGAAGGMAVGSVSGALVGTGFGFYLGVMAVIAAPIAGPVAALAAAGTFAGTAAGAGVAGAAVGGTAGGALGLVGQHVLHPIGSAAHTVASNTAAGATKVAKGAWWLGSTAVGYMDGWSLWGKGGKSDALSASDIEEKEGGSEEDDNTIEIMADVEPSEEDKKNLHLTSRSFASPLDEEDHGDGLVGGVQRTSYGKECKNDGSSGSRCGMHGKGYNWCYVTSGGWDYCALGGQTSRGWDCKIETTGDISDERNHCDYHGKRYQWCYTASGKWDYCVA